MEDSIAKLEDWLHGKSDNKWYAYIKRLSGNDTGLTGGHQVGVYVPRAVMAATFPSIQRTDLKNPDYLFEGHVDSHNLGVQELRAIYYNTKHYEHRSNGRDEQRITRWSTGVSATPLQISENTGALVIFAFHVQEDGLDTDELSVWVCSDVAQEDYIENLIGEVLPGSTVFKRADELFGGVVQLPLFEESELEMPEMWEIEFPTAAEIVDFVVKQYPYAGLSPDDRLLKRRVREYEVFRALEDLHVLARIKHGFDSVEVFVNLANSISNRRKSRSGRSLELHIERVFREEGLVAFETQATTEGKKKPDFLFPGMAAYHSSDTTLGTLNMLAVKTTCKDRWRQILNEAHLIPSKYLFTLQEGVSENQFNEMADEGVLLVVPEPNKKKFPINVRNKLLSLDSFIKKMKSAAQL